MSPKASTTGRWTERGVAILSKTLAAANRSERDGFFIPRSVQQSIPIKRICSDGIFQVGRKYSRSWRFSDINYASASDEDQDSIFRAYSAALNSLPTDATTKITIVNRSLNQTDFARTILMAEQGDRLDRYRREYNRLLTAKAAESNNLIQEKYITVSIPERKIEEARSWFRRVDGALSKSFGKLDSTAKAVSCMDRLRLFHDFFRPGEEGRFHFDPAQAMRFGVDFRDAICPGGFAFYDDYFEMGDKVGRVLFLRDFGAYGLDDMVAELSAIPRSLMLSIDILPVPTAEAAKEIQNLILGVETDIARWQQRQNARNNFTATIPYELEQQRAETKEFLDDLTTRDQRMIFVNVTLVHVADTMEQLKADTASLLSIGQEKYTGFSILRYQQEDGLNTALPYGLRRIKSMRTLTTESAAVFTPFRAQDLQEPGGLYYGVNAVTHNLILCNRKNLLNGGGFIVGLSGAGKSMLAKNELTGVVLEPDNNDDILVVDPDGEYAPLIEALGGTVLKISAGSPNHINAMDINADYAGEDDPILLKIEFIMSLCEQIMGSGKLGAQERSILGRCVNEVYQGYLQRGFTGEPPTLKDLYAVLLAQPDPEARSLALALELFATGSLNIFAHQTNIDLSSRILCFDILDLGKQLRPVGMLVMLDAIVNRVTANRQKRKRTWILIDEIRLFFGNEYSANFLERSWLNFRKYGGLPTGLIQNAEKCLNSETARFLFGNSEFLIILKQSPADMKMLVPLLGISETQANYIKNAEAGCGLIRYGNAMIPFRNELPADTELYRLMTTKPGER